VLFFVKYVGCLLDAVYQDPVHLDNYTTKSMCLLCINVDNLVLCNIAVISFPDDDPLWIETCRYILCDIIISISKERYCAFVSLSVANWLTKYNFKPCSPWIWAIYINNSGCSEYYRNM
jgi:hypothetical protein